LDAVAGTLYQGECQIDLGDNTCDIEAAGIPNTTVILSDETRADRYEAIRNIRWQLPRWIIGAGTPCLTSIKWIGKCTNAKGGKKWKEEMHVVLVRRIDEMKRFVCTGKSRAREARSERKTNEMERKLERKCLIK